MEADWAIVTLTSTLVIITAVYAFLTHRIANETRRALREANRAIVIVGYQARGNLLLLAVRNVGQRAAQDVSFDVAVWGPTELHPVVGLSSAQGLLGRGFGVLAPAEAHYIDVGQVSGARNFVSQHGGANAGLEVTIRYHDGFEPLVEKQRPSPTDVFATQFRTPIPVEMDNDLRIAQALDVLAGTSPGISRTHGGVIDVLREIRDSMREHRQDEFRRR